MYQVLFFAIMIFDDDDDDDDDDDANDKSHSWGWCMGPATL